jgi:hypothetical protein
VVLPFLFEDHVQARQDGMGSARASSTSAYDGVTVVKTDMSTPGTSTVPASAS